jgi:hypothetical protein
MNGLRRFRDNPPPLRIGVSSGGLNWTIPLADGIQNPFSNRILEPARP